MRALSFIGTGISSSELSSLNCFGLFRAWNEDACWLSLLVKADREGGWRKACCRCDIRRVGPAPPMGVGDAAVAMLLFCGLAVKRNRSWMASNWRLVVVGSIKYATCAASP